MLRVDYDRWGETPADLRHMALNAAHTRTRERMLALHDIAQGACATQVAERTGSTARCGAATGGDSTSGRFEHVTCARCYRPGATTPTCATQLAITTATVVTAIKTK